MEIRWDTSHMAELSAGLDDKSRMLAEMRLDVHGICHRHDSLAPHLRQMVIAAAWVEDRAEDLMVRRRRLLDAESGFLWQLQARSPVDAARPPLRSRSSESIEAQLDGAFETLAWLANGLPDISTSRAELRVAELTYELAVARRNEYLLGVDLPEPAVVGVFTEIMDHLGYQIARSRQAPPLDWRRITAAAGEIQQLLDESWFGDVGRADLLAIQEALQELDSAEMDAVIDRLSSDELYRWFHELDGIRGGNLREPEESELFAIIARTAGAATLFRLAGAERGTRFHVVAAAVRAQAAPEIAMEFIEMCAAEATATDDALVAVLAGLAALDGRRRTVVATSLAEQNLLDPLALATAALVSRQSIDRDSPIVVEFFEGLAGALLGAATTLGELSFLGLVDRHRFREAWSNMGGVIQLAFDDPVSFIETVLDIETLRHNPARWSGAAATDVVSVGVGRLAKIGRLGRFAQTAARWLRRVGDLVLIDTKRLSVQTRHVTAALQEFDAATTAAAIRGALAELTEIESYIRELDDLVAVVPEVDSRPFSLRMSDMGAAGADLVDRFAAAVTAAAGSAAARLGSDDLVAYSRDLAE